MSIVETQSLSKRYGRTQALNKLDLTIEAGEPIALIGPNGAGKTTLLSLLCGFILPTDGVVKVLDEIPGSQALSGRLGALPQDAQFDPVLSLGKQLHFYAQLQGMDRNSAKNEVARVLDLIQLPEAANMKPDALSHGMRKRMALAQALMGKPEVVLLDEPTAGVDPPNVKIIRDLVHHQSDKATFVISSHNLDELEKLCSTVIYLEKGQLVQAGSMDTQADDDVQHLTIRMIDIDESKFIEACQSLPGVLSVEQQAQGDFLITGQQDASIDQTLLSMLSEKGWRYRSFTSGRSLEDRLYSR